MCPIGYDKKIEDIVNLGYVECGEAWAKKMRYFSDPQSNTCATCIRNSDYIPPAVPYGPGGCPEYYVFEERELCATPPSSTGSFQESDGVELATCSSLGAGWVTSRATAEGCAAKMSTGTVVVHGTKYACTACVLPPKHWEQFAGPFNRACRGAGPTDNNPEYFEVRQNIPTVEACQALCLEELGEEGCKGIEYNRNSKRCELWKRKEGIWAFTYPQWQGFTCLRYGWPGKFLIPLNGGLDQACRGPGGKNSESFYSVEAVRHMEDCRARCVAASICKGLEFSKGRCEIWHSEIATTASRAGYECLRYQPPVQ